MWREGQLDVDFIVSSEVETAHAVSRTVAVPAARQTDVFAEGQVQLVEFDVSESTDPSITASPLREASLPADSRLAAIIRGDDMRLPGGNDMIAPGDRIVVIGSPQAAQAWSELIAPGTGKVNDVVIFGAGHNGTAIARVLLAQGIGVRLIEASLERARVVARSFRSAHLPRDGSRPRLSRARADRGRQVSIFAMRDDMKNHFAATLARLHGAGFTIAIVHEGPSVEVFEQAGIDVTIDPRQVTAEEIVRFAHDPGRSRSRCSRATASRCSTSRRARAASTPA